MSAPPIDLRGIHLRRMKRHVVLSTIAGAISLVAVLAWRKGRKDKFEKFYSNFDNSKLEEAMIKDGVFQSILPDGKVTTEPWK